MDKKKEKVVVIIPALNEEENIGRVIINLPKNRISEIIVVDNGSEDATAAAARMAGARVVEENIKGYGAACMRGLKEAEGADIVLFIDGDCSDYPEEAVSLLNELDKGYDMVIGSRLSGKRERGALPPHSIFGNRLMCALINFSCGTKYTDLGPFRAVRYDKLMALGMSDPDFGWTVEMAMRAAGAGWNVSEIPVKYRKRFAGKSKITGSVTASIRTAIKMFRVFFSLRKRIAAESSRG